MLLFVNNKMSTLCLSLEGSKVELIPIKLSSVCLCVHTFKDEYIRNQWVDRNQILTEASLGWGKGCTMFWVRSDQIPWQHIAPIRLYWKQPCQHSSTFNSDLIFVIIAGNKNNHNTSDELKIWPDQTKDCGVSCP